MFIAVTIFVINGIMLNFIHHGKALIALPPVEDNDILKAGGIIKNTTNKLFSTLKFRSKKGNPKLERFSLIHTYLVSLALRDHSSLTEIAKLTRVEKRNNSDVHEHFNEIINEIVDNNAKYVGKNEEDENEDSILNYVTNYMHNLEYMLHFYSKHNPQWDLQFDIMKYFENKLRENSTAEDPEDGDVKDYLEIWNPELDTRRIFRGKRTKIKMFPFMASVEIFGKFTCGGSIIHNDLVITAASCLQLAWNNRFYRENPAFLSVRIGSTFIEYGGEKVEVLEVYFHPGYDPTTLRNNLAIMRLLRKIRFSRSHRKQVMKIKFDTQDHSLPNTAGEIYVIGWGAKTTSNLIHNPWEQRLAYDTLGVYGLQDCQDIYSKQYVTKKHFCAGYISKGGGACNRDVGGPAVIDGVLTGVISFGSPVCGAVDSPTVFTKVGFYADWIEEIIEQKVPSVKRETTTVKSYDPQYEYKHTTAATEKIKLIYKHKVTTTEIPEEETTVNKHKLLRDQKQNEPSSDFSYKEYGTPQILAVAASYKIGTTLSRDVMPATEMIPINSTVITDMDPKESSASDDSNSESIEHPEKVSTTQATDATTGRKESEYESSRDHEIESAYEQSTPDEIKKTESQSKSFKNLPSVRQHKKLIQAAQQSKLTIYETSNEKLTGDETKIKSQSIVEPEERKYDENDFFEPQTLSKSKIKQPPTKSDKIKVNQPSKESQERKYDEEDENMEPTVSSKKLKQSPLKSDKVIFSVIREDDDEKADESTDEENKQTVSVKKNINNRPEKTPSQSDDYDDDAEQLRIVAHKMPSHTMRNNNNKASLQSILTNEDILEILSEALRENLNISLPVLSRTARKLNSFRTERTTI